VIEAICELQQPAVEQPAAPAQPVDAAGVRALLNELRNLLANDDMASLRQIEALRGQLGAGAPAQLLARLQDAAQQFDFAAALARLDELADELGGG